MVPVGIWLGTFGYVLLYYGAKLWTGQPVGMADIFSLGQPAAAPPATLTGKKTATGQPLNQYGGVGTGKYGPTAHA